MGLIKPDIGLLFWMLVSFGTVLFILGKFAWKPILKALRDREHSIEDALNSAEKAKEEMAKLKADNELILKEAQKERDLILKEAKEYRDKIVAEAKDQAGDDAKKIIESAKARIETEKKAAIGDMKKELSILSVEIAEKILRKELSNPKEQKEYIDQLIDNVNLN